MAPLTSNMALVMWPISFYILASFGTDRQFGGEQAMPQSLQQRPMLSSGGLLQDPIWMHFNV